MKCKICGKRCENNNDLLAHLQIAHKLKQNNNFVCEICKKDDLSFHGYLTHMRCKHGLTKKDVYDKFHLKELDSKCGVCSLKTEFAPRENKWGYAVFCKKHALEDRNRRRKETTLKKYGVANVAQSKTVQDKIVTSCRKKYGTDRPAQSRVVQEKAKRTNIERYGVDHTGQAEDIKKKIRVAFKGKYEGGHPLKDPKIIAKRKETMISLYGEDNASKIPEFRRKAVESAAKFYSKQMNERLFEERIKLIGEEYNCKIGIMVRVECLDCGKRFNGYVHNGLAPMCPSCNPTGRSKSEKELAEFLSKDLNLDIIIGSRKVISPLELDIYIPDYNLAIEYNGLYWHTEQWGRGRNFHLSKTELCEEKGIQLLHIFSSDDLDIWKSVIMSKLGIVKKTGARHTNIVQISGKEANRFCQENHLQGSVNASLRLGLVYNDTLVSVMTFGKTRFNNNYQWELLRFCTLKGYQVIGGASKLLNHSGVKNCISYANRRWSNGKLYDSIGFEKVGESQPNYFYTKGSDNLYSRNQFQKHKLSTRLDKFDPNLTEYQNMFNNGYDRIWDCGNLVYEYVR